MKPEVIAALAYLESPSPDLGEAGNAADLERVTVLRRALEQADLAILGLVRSLAAVTDFGGVNIDSVHHSHADRAHVHHVGV